MKSSWLFVLLFTAIANAAPLEVSTEFYDSKSCLFLSKDKKQILSFDLPPPPPYGEKRSMELKAHHYRPFRSWAGGNPGGLDLYATNPFRGMKLKSFTSLGNDRDTSSLCQVFENGEAYCNGFRASGGDYILTKAAEMLSHCDLFFVHKDKTLPEFSDLYRGVQCRIKVPLDDKEEIEKIVFSDREEYMEPKWGHNEHRQGKEPIRSLCYLTKAGQVKCLGDNHLGMVGNEKKEGTYPEVDEAYVKAKAKPVLSLAPHSVNLGKDAKGIVHKSSDVCLYNNYACAIVNDGQVKCWGSQEIPMTWTNIINDQKWYAKGNKAGDMGDALKEIPLGQDSDGRPNRAKKLSCAYTHFCIVLEHGGLKCLGANTFGQLGIEGEQKSSLLSDLKNDGSSSPNASILGRTAVSTVFTQSSSTCAVLESGHLSCFGRNTGGLLGHPYLIDGHYPYGTDYYSEKRKFYDAGGDRIRLDDKTKFPIVPIDKGIVGGCMEARSPFPEITYFTRKFCALYENGTVTCWLAGWDLRKNLEENSQRIPAME